MLLIHHVAEIPATGSHFYTNKHFFFFFWKSKSLLLTNKIVIAKNKYGAMDRSNPHPLVVCLH